MNLWKEFTKWINDVPSKKEFREYWDEENSEIANGICSDYWKKWAFERDYDAMVMQKKITELETRLNELQSPQK